MEKRVLITGASGFAGHYVAPHMAAKGYDVIGTTHVNTGATVSGVRKMYTVDLIDFDNIQTLVQSVQPTHVVHLAAISFVAHEDTREIYDTNIVGSRNLLRALALCPQKPQSVLLTSSANIYGNSVKQVLSETDEMNPANDYAVSKVGMELMSRQFTDVLNIMIARPFNYTGRGQAPNFLIPKIVEHIKAKSEFVELGNTDVTRDFSDVRTVAAYLVRLLEEPNASGNVYNICTGKPISLQSVIDICQRISGHSIEVRINPRFQRANEVKFLIGNPWKLHNTVGTIDNYTLEDTLTWMLQDA